MRTCLAGLVLLVLVACSPNASPVPTPGVAELFRTSTPTSTPTIVPSLEQIFLPTPTTFLYTIVQGDTLAGIAARFDLTLEALNTANPGLLPSALQVGSQLIIPSVGALPTESVPTPAPVVILQTPCHSPADGSLWCFALLQNNFPEPLENLSARFSLVDENDREIDSLDGYGYINVLPPGRSMPLAVHFAVTPAAPFRLRVQVLTAFRLLAGDDRYPPVDLDNIRLELNTPGRTATLSGRVLFTSEKSGSALWVLATAYDSSGNVVGVRRWAHPTEITSTQPIPFEFQISSLAAPIERVDLIPEAQP